MIGAIPSLANPENQQAENIPKEFNVALLANVLNPHAIHGAKGIGTQFYLALFCVLSIANVHPIQANRLCVQAW